MSKIKDLEKENAELKEKLASPFTITKACPFSSNPGRHNGWDETATRKCSHPLGPDMCHKCAVAANWEEAYG